jgi:uncharacterized RDD family membrane protein YckC
MTPPARRPLCPAPRATRFAPLFALALLATGVATVVAPGAAFAGPRDLQAHGSDERIWLSRTEPAPSGKAGASVTTLFVREKFVPDWHRLPPIGTRVLGMGSRGLQLAVLLESGEWRLATDGGLASGRPLPDGGRMIALGSDASALWAVARVPEHPATRPSTRASSTTGPVRGAPATTSVAQAVEAGRDRLVLYRLGAPGWEQQGELPPQIAPVDGLVLSLGIAGGVPMVAQQAGPRVVRIYVRTAAKDWQTLPDVESPQDVRDFKVLSGTPTPALWYRDATGVGRLWLRAASAGAAPVTRELGVPDKADHAVAYANGAIRVLWFEGGKILEQPLALDAGLTPGEVTSWPVPAESILPAVQFWTQVVVTTAVVFALASSIRRRREMQDIELDPAKLRLAPLSTRLIAGAIDAVPLLVALWFARSRYSSNAELGFLLTLAIGLGVYLLLTTLFEVIVGRSLGKLVTGLYVVGLDSKPASIGARLTRNLLRVIDLPVMPLALILFSPLRQRAGDLAAGTLVVTGKSETENERVREGKRQKDEG